MGIVAVGAFDDGEIIIQQSGEPFLYDGFAVGSCDADDRVVETLAMVFCECLQGIEGVVHNKEVGPAVQVGVGRVGYHKISHAALQKFRDEPVSVILCGFEGEKEGFLGLANLATVVAETRNMGFFVTDVSAGGLYDIGNFGNIHVVIF